MSKAQKSERYEACREYISEHVRQQIDLSREVDDLEIREMIDELIIQMGRKYALSLKQRDRKSTRLNSSHIH